MKKPIQFAVVAMLIIAASFAVWHYDNTKNATAAKTIAHLKLRINDSIREEKEMATLYKNLAIASSSLREETALDVENLSGVCYNSTLADIVYHEAADAETLERWIDDERIDPDLLAGRILFWDFLVRDENKILEAREAIRGVELNGIHNDIFALRAKGEDYFMICDGGELDLKSLEMYLVVLAHGADLNLYAAQVAGLRNLTCVSNSKLGQYLIDYSEVELNVKMKQLQAARFKLAQLIDGPLPQEVDRQKLNELLNRIENAQLR